MSVDADVLFFFSMGRRRSIIQKVTEKEKRVLSFRRGKREKKKEALGRVQVQGSAGAVRPCEEAMSPSTSSGGMRYVVTAPAAASPVR